MTAFIGWLRADCISISPSPSAIKVGEVKMSKTAVIANFLNIPESPVGWLFPRLQQHINS
jgi:hypothetical protein